VTIFLPRGILGLIPTRQASAPNGAAAAGPAAQPAE